MLIYFVLRLFRGTLAIQLLRGMLIIGLIFLILTQTIDLVAVSWLLRVSAPIILFAIPVIFQPELRRALERVGRSAPLAMRRSQSAMAQHIVTEVVRAVEQMAERKHGALIVFEGTTGLADAIERNGWRFKIISNEPPELDFPYEFVKWRHASFSAEIAECAVGVFPRDFDNDYDRGHSFFKIGVFLSRHVPVVCSPVPSYAEIATPRNSRIVPALDPKAWETALASLLDSSWTPDFSENPVERFTPRRIAEKLKTLLETTR
jgi:hypothetical protein